MRLGRTSLKKMDFFACFALAFHYLCTVETVLRLNRERSEILRQSRCCKFYLSSTAFATEARLREGAVVGNESEDLPFRYCQTSITSCADRFQL